ncbi:MAG: alpha/beta hydrolase [Actinobacteria bacterium]|nr:alpha/beta hydrolase [Actinomycetota bacterium]
MTDSTGFHPLYQARLHLLEGVPGPGAADTPETLRRRRAFDAPFGAPELPRVRTEERDVPGPNGPVRIRIYRARTATDEPAPGLVWIHGGAFMYNDLDVPEADHFARHVAHRTGTVVVSVAYRLCDGTVHFPVPHDDCYAAYTWTVQHADELGIDPARLAIGGGSAGGNLAASVALHASEVGQRPWQMLLAYPVLHAELPPASAELRAALAQTPDAMRFTPESSVDINEHVMGKPIGAATPYDFPALAHDPSRFPPAYIENSEFDELRASGEAFADLLISAGVDVEQVTAKGVPHGHLNAVGSPMLAEAYDRFAARLQNGPTR